MIAQSSSPEPPVVANTKFQTHAENVNLIFDRSSGFSGGRGLIVRMNSQLVDSHNFVVAENNLVVNIRNQVVVNYNQVVLSTDLLSFETNGAAGSCVRIMCDST